LRIRVDVCMCVRVCVSVRGGWMDSIKADLIVGPPCSEGFACVCVCVCGCGCEGGLKVGRRVGGWVDVCVCVCLCVLCYHLMNPHPSMQYNTHTPLLHVLEALERLYTCICVFFLLFHAKALFAHKSCPCTDQEKGDLRRQQQPVH